MLQMLQMLGMIWTPEAQLLPPSLAWLPAELCARRQQEPTELGAGAGAPQLLQPELARRGRAALRRVRSCCQPSSPGRRKMQPAAVWEGVSPLAEVRV